MKKPSNSKNSPAKKSNEKSKDLGEVKKVTKLKPLKEKEKQSWKNSLNEEDDEDFTIEDDLKSNSSFDEDDEDEEEDGYYDDKF